MIKNENTEKALFEAIDALGKERYSAKDIQDLVNGYVQEKDFDVLHSGTHGECSWDIDKDGVLRIYPTENKEGMLANTLDFGERENTYDIGNTPWRSYEKEIQKVIVEQGVKANQNANGLFAYLSNCKEIDVRELDTSRTEDMRYMFGSCENLMNLDLSSLNTSNARDMGYMFGYSENLKDLNITTFDTSKVTNMYGMFKGCANLTNLDVSSFNTSKVEQIAYMFDGCKKLESLNLSNFNLGNLQNYLYSERMSGMFRDCSALKELNLGSGFLEAQILRSHKPFEEVPLNMKLISSNVNAINLGFENKTIHPENDKNLVASGTHGECSWDIEKDGTLRIYPTNGKEGMLANTSVFEEIPYAGTPLPPWVNQNFEPNGVKKVIVEKGVKTNSDATGLFSYLPECKEMDISNLDTSRATSMYDMFWGCSSLTSLDVSNFDVRSVTEMSHIFAACDSLKELNLGDRFLESQLAHAKAFEWGTPSDLKIISTNVDAINLGLKNETIRPESPNKSTKEAWKPKPKKEEKLPFKVKVKTKSTKSSNFDDVKI